MHSATCPSCGTVVEVDFRPVAGRVWCPTCQKLFSQPAAIDPPRGSTFVEAPVPEEEKEWQEFEPFDPKEGWFATEEEIDDLPPA